MAKSPKLPEMTADAVIGIITEELIKSDIDAVGSEGF